MSLSNKKSVGYDDISITILKRCAQIISLPLSNIINQCFEQGVFPDALKKAIVIPVHKKGDIKNASNYRPISLISNITKIFEKALNNRLMNYLYSNNIIAQEQHGFIKGGSTILSIFKVIDTITKSWEDKTSVVLILLDLQKAFDCVDKQLLLCKLEKYGIRGSALDLFSSYMSNRKQCTKINGVFSSWKDITNGVPQGSILAPSLFLLFINDLPKAITNKLFLFADDTAIICESRDQQQIVTEVQMAITNLNKWFTENGLKLNENKTEILTFGNYYHFPSNIDVLGTIINTKNTAKFLGIIIDKHLNWKPHIEYILTKLNRAICLIKILKSNSIQAETLIQVYHAVFHSVLQYGLIFWGNSTLASKVFRLQKKCVRIIVGASYCEHCKPIFKALKILTVQDQYVLDLACFIKNNYNLFKTNVYNHDYKTRFKDNMKTDQAHLSITRDSVRNMAMRIYNKIPADIKCIEQIKKFKQKLKERLLKCNLYNIDHL